MRTVLWVAEFESYGILFIKEVHYYDSYYEESRNVLQHHTCIYYHKKHHAIRHILIFTIRNTNVRKKIETVKFITTTTIMKN